MSAELEHRLAELLREARRHREALREFGLAGYVTMVEQHRAKLDGVLAQIHCLCEEHDLELPPELERR